MPFLELHERDGFLVLDDEECRVKGSALRSRYVDASPSPHIVLDHFIDQAVLRRVIDEFPSSGDRHYFNRAQERLKYQYAPKHWTGGTTHNLFALFNSAAFVSFLEEMTGFEGLIPDPRLQARRSARDQARRAPGRPRRLQPAPELASHPPVESAHLSERRLVTGVSRESRTLGQGHDRVRSSGAPELGRAVVFTTALDSFHGHPEPLPVHRTDLAGRWRATTTRLRQKRSPTFRGASPSFKSGRDRVTRPTGR